MEVNLTPIIKDSFTQYAGAVLQSRALIDVRDGLKPSARQIFYSMLTRKLTSSNPHKKTANAVGMAMADYYIHGDSSCTAVIMRAGQPFAMRYPLVDVKGNAGSLIESGNWASMRYTESRLSKLSNILFEDIDKETIFEWRDSYDNTKQFPAVLPTKGYYNIVNGCQGIGIGMASSVPQYNLKELNTALIHLLYNPDCDFEEIYCAPDFATGAILYNEEEVKQSMKNGTGFACKLRSVVEFDAKDRCFVITEIPYNVYTNTICGELEQIIEDEKNPGIERFNDLTGKTALIKIYLSKKANPDKVLRYLYKNTSLQYYYSINFTMLDQGRYPRLFTWKEMLQAHLEHEKSVYINGFQFDRRKILARLHVIEGLMKAISMIDEVIKIIKQSADAKNASIGLQRLLSIDEIQAKAILDLKLSRLTHLDITKLETERSSLETEKERIEAILGDETLLKKEIEKGLREVAEKFGDVRRTKILNISNDEETIEQKQLSLSFTNEGAVFVSETSTLYSQRRNGVGSKFKLDKGEFVVDTLIGNNTDEVLFFTQRGAFYHLKMGEFNIGEKQYLNSFLPINGDDEIKSATILSKDTESSNILFLTKKGILKKSALSEYNLRRNTGVQALKLDDDDLIASILILKNERVGILTEEGNFIIIETKDIRPIGRVARGVVGIKLNEGDKVVSGRVIPKETREILSVSEDGYSKRTDINEFKITGRATKGVKIQRAGNLCDFLPLIDSSDILVVSSTTQIRVKVEEIPILSRGTQGVKTLKLGGNSKVIKIQNF
jgi:DNA gyrase, A subunit|nr:MAG TPA: DNA topoisomerase 2 alpha [Caudoviricetes sp.]